MTRVIARGQEALLRDGLAAEALGLRLVDFSIEAQRVVVRYRGEPGLCFLRLALAEDSGAQRLLVVGIRSASKALALALKRHVEAQLDGLALRTEEVDDGGRAPPREIEAMDDLHIDVQEAGFVAGCKPAIRQTMRQSELAALTRRLEPHGAVVEVAGQVDFGGGPLFVLCIARDRMKAEALRDAEQELLASNGAADPQRLSVLHRQVGRLLGYPDCCVEAFVGRVRMDLQCPPGELRWSLPFQAAREARGASNLARLNNLRLGEGVGYISFEPCRYDCADALRVADSMADAAALIDPPSREAMDQVLHGDLVLGAAGPRAGVRLEGEEIREAVAIARTREGPDADDLEFARRLVGCAVPDADDPDQLLLRFKTRTDASP